MGKVSENEEWVEFILKHRDEQEEGYFLEADLEYPEGLHDLHDKYLCAPENI